jgi:hypothetical protein
VHFVRIVKQGYFGHALFLEDLVLRITTVGIGKIVIIVKNCDEIDNRKRRKRRWENLQPWKNFIH